MCGLGGGGGLDQVYNGIHNILHAIDTEYTECKQATLW